MPYKLSDIAEEVSTEESVQITHDMIAMAFNDTVEEIGRSQAFRAKEEEIIKGAWAVANLARELGPEITGDQLASLEHQARAKAKGDAALGVELFMTHIMVYLDNIDVIMDYMTSR